VAGRLHKIHSTSAEANGVAIAYGSVGEGGAGTISEINACAGSFCELAMTRNKVGVQVGLDHVADPEAFLLGCFQVHVHIPLRVNDCCDTI
jgi:hypothetical protein